MTTATHCLNCQHPLGHHDHYCSQCGQQTNVHRLGWHDVSHGLFHYFAHADKSLLGLLKGLATKPGVVAHDYIKGRRKHWFNPYTFFLLCVSVFVFTYVFFHAMETPVAKVDPAIMAKLSEAGKKAYADKIIRASQVQHFARHYNNLLSMLSVPVAGIILWLGFKKKGLNYFETVTSLMYFRGFATLTITLAFAPVLGYAKDNLPLYLQLVALSQLLLVLYQTWAYHQLLRCLRPTSFWYVLAIAVAAHLFWMLISAGGFSLYIAQPWVTF